MVWVIGVIWAATPLPVLRIFRYISFTAFQTDRPGAGAPSHAPRVQRIQRVPALQQPCIHRSTKGESMAALSLAYLRELEEYMSSGAMLEDFEYSPEERRHEMLEFLEVLMDVADLADETATKMIFKNSQMSAFFGLSDQK